MCSEVHSGGIQRSTHSFLGRGSLGSSSSSSSLADLLELETIFIGSMFWGRRLYRAHVQLQCMHRQLTCHATVYIIRDLKATALVTAVNIVNSNTVTQQAS